MAGLVHDAPAAQITLPKRMTRAEYWELPEDAPRCELIAGKTHMVPAPDEWHQDIAFELAVAIRKHVLGNTLGKVFLAPIALSLPDDTELQPDLMVLQTCHPDLGTRFKFVSHAPWLVIEVMSPSTRTHDKRRKFGLYESAGVLNYWIADPDARSIEAWTLVDGVYQPAGQASAPAKVAFPPFGDLVLDLDTIFPKAT
jgi:Uma2 family endonuclease